MKLKKITLRKIRGILGIVVVCVSMLLTFAWETKGRDKYLGAEVVVLKRDLQEGEKVASEYIEMINVDKDKVIIDAIMDSNKIIGKAAKHFIPKGTQLVEKYFDEYEVIPGADEYIFKVPTEWVISMPDTMRRKDTAYFYEIEYSKIPDVDSKVSKNFGDGIRELTKDKEPIESFTVAYVKDSSSQEVVDTGEDRFNSSSKIANLEVIADAQKIGILEEAALKGSKFIVLYK